MRYASACFTNCIVVPTASAMLCYFFCRFAASRLGQAAYTILKLSVHDVTGAAVV